MGYWFDRWLEMELDEIRAFNRLMTNPPTFQAKIMTDNDPGNVIALSVNTECPIDNSMPMSMRVNFTRTSGTLVAAITSQIPA